MPPILYCYSNMGRHYIHEYLTSSDSMNYFDSNRTNTVILEFEVVKVMRCLRNFKIVKMGIKRLKAKLWLKLLLKIPIIILVTRFNINCITNKQL